MAVCPDYPDEAVEAIAVLQREGWTVRKIAKALGRSHRGLEKFISRSRKIGKIAPTTRVAASTTHAKSADNPIEGEVWHDIPGRQVAVSSHDRVRSMRTDRLLRPFFPHGVTTFSIRADDGKRTSASLARLRAEATGVKPRRPDGWTDEEKRQLARAATLEAAAVAIPSRSNSAIKAYAKRLRKRFQRPTAEKVTACGSVPYGNALYEEALRTVPRGHPDADDLRSEMVALRLGGFSGTAQEAYALVRKALSRQANWGRNSSLDQTLPGFDGLRMIDIIASDRPHF